MNQYFDVGRSEMDPGVTLIEASAGTGKTFAIAGMAVRLIAEKGVALNRILVVTFTEAATKELRDRVRSRIREAVVSLEEGRPGDDPALTNFVDADVERTAAAIRRLKNALLSFDEAVIFTIHGFCQRMLRENAFETGALFDVELVTDVEPIWLEAAQDFWRKRFYESNAEIGSLVAALQADKRLSSDDFVNLLRKLSRHPELTILSEQDSISLEECEVQLTRAIEEARQEWRASSAAITEVLTTTNALSVNKKNGYPQEVIESILEDLAALEKEGALSPAALAALENLSARKLEANIVRNRPAPVHPFFEICARIEELVQAFIRLVRVSFREYAQEGLTASKKSRNVVTFDDLLTRLYEALEGPGGEELAVAIGSRFSAALIDEFQDTDPVQWRIFKKVFGGGRHALFLIGDPKQAIYSFRGADIFTYMEARLTAGTALTLGTNWRSDSELVGAANELFSRHDKAFVFPEISFSPVRAAEKNRGSELDLTGTDLGAEPLRMVCVAAEDGGVINAGPARERILGMLAGEINRLLVSGAKRNGEFLEPGDIAVLVRTNKEAESVRERLVREAIPAVVRTDSSVLQTDEAEHLIRLLGAVLEPHKNGLVKGALACPLFGCDSRKIYELDQDEDQWQELTAKFHDWQESWNRHGFMGMFRMFLEGEELNVRLLALPDGERMVTNYQHVAECLHAAEYEKNLTPSGLLRWLREQSEGAGKDGDSHVIRLEKDENAVQIVTIHRSKGLEYPIVFCPFSWSGNASRPNGKDIVFHDKENGNRLTWDLRPKPADESVEAFEREQLAEAMRLLYVAVTRARNRCYLFWAVTKDSAKPHDCALAHLFGCGTADGPETPLAAFDSLAEGGKAAMDEPVEGSSDSKYKVFTVDAAELVSRTFERSLPLGPLVTSFSGLTAQVHEERPDHDALPETAPAISSEAQGDSGPSIFSFPKGAKAGNFFHNLLETLDFTDTQNLPDQVAKQLALFRFDQNFAPVIVSKVQELLDVPLPGGVRLAEVGQRDRLVEAPFYFPIQRVTPQRLAAIFQKENLPGEFTNGLGRLRFYPVDGYMTGFMDLVFRQGNRYYLVDWKSNWLGPGAADYHEEALRRAMAESYYYLQYHLYTLALHRHLGRTLPDYDYESHFGGIFYVFLRGVDSSDPSTGIFSDRPSAELVDRLEETLLGRLKAEVEV